MDFKKQESKEMEIYEVAKGDCMRKMIVVFTTTLAITCGAFSIQSAKAGLLDPIQATLIDHVEATTQFDDKGNERISLLDSVIRIGSYEGESLFHVQAGFSGDTAPEQGQNANWVAGAMLRLDPFIHGVEVPSHWEFLKSLQVGIGYYFDFETEEEFPALNIGLAFDPAPIK